MPVADQAVLAVIIAAFSLFAAALAYGSIIAGGKR